MNFQDLQEKRDEVLAFPSELRSALIAAKHGARNVRVFGSVVRGEATPESDVDFLIDLREKLSPWFPTGLIHELEDLLGRKVDVVTAKSVHYFIRDRILEEAKPL